MQYMVHGIIQNHNNSLLKDPAALTANEFSYRQKSNCPLSEKCLLVCLVYHAYVDRSDINQIKIFIVLAKKKFTECHRNHTTSFRINIEGKSTELSKYI